MYLLTFKVLEYWREHNLPLQPLQSFINSNAERLCRPFSTLLKVELSEQAHIGTIQWLMGFPQIILLKILQAFFNDMRSNADSSNCSVERLN